MKPRSRILAGTALALLMASPLAAAPLPASAPSESMQAPRFSRPALLLMAQADDEQQPSEDAQPRKKHRKAQDEQAPAEAAPAAQPEEPAQPRRKHRDTQEERQPAAEAAPAERAPAEEPMRPRKKNQAIEPSAQGEAAPAPAEAPLRKKKQKETSEQPAPNTEAMPAQPEQPAEATPEKPRRKGDRQKPADERPAANGEAAPAQPEQPAEATPEKLHRKGDKQKPADERPASNGEAAPNQPEQPAEATPEKPHRKGDKQKPGDERPAPGDETAGEGNVAPGPDSQKVAPGPDSQKVAPVEGRDRNAGQGWNGRDGKRRPEPADAGPPPADDKAAQREVRPEKIEPVTAERGKRVKERPVDMGRRERPKGAEVLKELGDRVIIELGKQIMVESDDRPRMTHGARDVYYEDLPRGRTRETIERGDGTRVVTIRNSYGDVIRRSRITPDGREYVLVYVDEDNFDRVRDWRDPGRDLPPLRLDIPEDDYIMTSDRVRDPDMYYRFLEQPPVERVERLYSIDEVKRSARIRDKTRRIDLDTITFDFGSASIAESEVTRLEGVANAMERILDQNPAETFLIEGHTDAVGSDMANLALSDRRAEAVAAALTNVFGIPPENLATQGYGEQFLKVKTQAPERQNRRVAIRRITPLVAPVASNR